MPPLQSPHSGTPAARANTSSLWRTPPSDTIWSSARCARAIRGRSWACPRVWYKSPAYRAKAVRDPRGVLADFGHVLPAETEIRVWDSTAEVRYLVVPMRPAGTEDLSEAELAELVTRDAMIGTDPLGTR